MLILFSSQLAQAQPAPTDRAEDALQRRLVSKKMRLVKQSTVKRSSLPIAKLGKTGKALLKGSAASMSAAGGNCEGDNNSQDACGGNDDFEVFEYSFGFDSIFNSPGVNDVARVEILERVEVTGWRTIFVRAETEWGGLELLLEDISNSSFRGIGIGDSDAAEIKDEAEQVKRAPKNLGTVKVNTSKPASPSAVGWETLPKNFPDAIHRDKALIKFSDGKCVEYELYDPFANKTNDWRVINATASCS
jgi:hypothetical protein